LEHPGADEVIPSKLETSIGIFARLLAHPSVLRHVVPVRESLMRIDHYRALRGLAISAEIPAETERIIPSGILESEIAPETRDAAPVTLKNPEYR
jgi:hypothetical protein